MMQKARRSIRLHAYDYSAPGLYFVTICTKDRACLFGEIREGKVELTELGKISEKYWEEISLHFPHVLLDEFVIMPNHVHGIIQIRNEKEKNVGAQNFEPLQEIDQPTNQFQHIIPKSLGAIIRGYKIGVSKWARMNTNLWDIWQRNFHDHIIRDEADLFRIREYIRQNPLQWDTDAEYATSF